MSLYRPLNPLRLNTNIPLRDACGTKLISPYPIAQAKVFNILIDNKGNSEKALFPCFL